MPAPVNMPMKIRWNFEGPLLGEELQGINYDWEKKNQSSTVKSPLIGYTYIHTHTHATYVLKISAKWTLQVLYTHACAYINVYMCAYIMRLTMIIKKSWAWDGGMWEKLDGVVGSIEIM